MMNTMPSSPAQRRPMPKPWWLGIGLFVLVMAGLAPAHAETTTYIVSNAQGTVVAKMDRDGNVTYTAAYRPYGQQAKGMPQPGPGYTGHVNDPATGLVYMQQRYYDPVIGRFISPDPVVPAPGNVFNFGRYTYANDNPVRFIDPFGRSPDDAPNGCGKTRSCVQDENGVWHWGTQWIRQWLSDTKRYIVDLQKTLPGLKVIRSGPYKNGKYYVYQLTGPDGKSITCCNNYMKERLSVVYFGEHDGISVNKRTVLNWFPLVHGSLGDQVGLNRTYDSSKHWKAIVIQTFLLQHNNKVITLPVVFKHVIVFNRGYVIKATTTPVIPYNP